jgi:hypothetical protein
VIDDNAVLVLRAKHHDLSICVHLNVMTGRPVKKVIRVDRLLRAVFVRRRKLAAQDETPVGALARIALQALK